MTLIPYAGKDYRDVPFSGRARIGTPVSCPVMRSWPMPKPRAVAIKPTPRQQRIMAENKAGLDAFRSNGMPDWARQIVEKIAFAHRVSVSEIASVRKSDRIVKARNEAIYRVKEYKPELSSPIIAKWFDRHHTSILHSIAWHQEATGEAKLVGYELNRVRKRVTAYRAWKKLQAMKESSE